MHENAESTGEVFRTMKKGESVRHVNNKDNLDHILIECEAQDLAQATLRRVELECNLSRC